MKNKLSIGIIGHTGSGVTTVIHAMKNKNPNVIIVDNDTEPDNCFVLNGIKYAPIIQPHKSKKHSTQSKKMSLLLGMGAMVYYPFILNAPDRYDRYHRELPKGIDIIKEYGLIQQKLSSLSRWERDTVVRIFEKNFFRID
jgi:hypothetical protein